MKISGTILNAKNNTPVVFAKIKLAVQDDEIAAVLSDEHGRYDYSTDDDYIGQTITYVIEKDGFEEKTFSSVIDKTEYQKKFLLREHEVIEDKKAKAKNIIIGISIFTALILIFLATQPQLTVKSVPTQGGDLSLSLNSERDYTYSIDRAWPWNLPIIKHIGKLKWELLEDKDWIYLHDAKGEGSQNVVITIYTPDSEFSPNPGAPYYANILIDNTGSVLWKNRLLTIPFDISNKKDKHPELSVNLRLSPNPRSINKEELDTFKPVGIKIDNAGTGTLFWVVRSNVSWITLMVAEDKPCIGNIRFIDCLGPGLEPKFGINFDQLKQELNESRTNAATGRITVRANNDCKMKLYITATKKESGYEILHSRTELWNKTEVIYEYAKPDLTPENVAGVADNNSTTS